MINLQYARAQTKKRGTLMKTDWKKNTTRFLFSQSISLFGSSLVQYAIMWYITLNTQSGVMMMVSIICGILPTFFLSPFAGVWADRYNRKHLIVIADAGIAVATLALAAIFMLGYRDIWLLFAVSAVRALGTGIQTPAVSAFLPQIVPEEKLTRVNGINNSLQSAITLVSPMVSGVLMSFAAIEVIFFIDVVTAALAIAVMLLFVHVPPHHKALQKQETGYFEDFRTGLGYIRQHRFVLLFFIYAAVFFFLVSPAAFLTPLQVARSFGDQVWRLTAIEIAFSGGMVLGGVLIAAWGGFKNRAYTMTAAAFAISICTVALGVVPVFWLYLLFMALTGLAIPVFSTPAMVMLQEKVEEDMMGRVFGVYGMISSSVMPIGMLLFGPVSDSIAIEWLLLVTGALMLVQSIFLLLSRTLRDAGLPARTG
jgi:DHA3 family macrolide efflux protein-like MFS transporter